MEPDRVDVILAQWGDERPDVDVGAMAIIGRVSRLEKLIRPRLDEVFARHGLESWEFDVLATLRRSGQPYQLTPGELLDATMVTSGAMTNRLNRLERRGYVKRSKSLNDGRQVLVTLTARGRNKIDDAVVDHAANESRLLAELNDRQRDQLAALLRTLCRSVETT